MRSGPGKRGRNQLPCQRSPDVLRSGPPTKSGATTGTQLLPRAALLGTRSSTMTSVRRQRRVLVGLAACLLVATQVPRVLRGDAAEVERQHRLLRAQTAQVVRDDLQMSGPKCRSFIESSPEGPVGGPHRAIVPQGIELADASLSTSTKRELAADRPRTGSHRQPGVFMLPPNAPRIFFISFNPTFTDTSYLCAIESAAVTNPTHRVDVYTPNVTDLNNVFQTRWSRTPLLSRVFALPLSHAEMFEATPFELWHTNGTYNESTWPDQNLGNAFRLAVLWKAGGTYLDMDIVSVNPIPPASRALATQDEILLNNAVLSFPARDPMVWALMEEFVRNYNGRRWCACF